MRIGNEYAAKTLCKAVQACYNFSVYTEDGTNETTGRSCMENKLIRSKYFLYLTEFFAGMSVMAVELGASRLMAPYFSSSQIVWTVIIGVIMIAMAIGNVWGGKLADKSATPDKLYRRLIIAAIWIALIPFVGRYLIAGISLLLALFVTKNFLVWAALAACLVIFAFPCVLLGTVTPSLTRFTVDNLDDTGKTVGRLNALNTIGSIIGTFVPTFVTIPAVGTAGIVTNVGNVFDLLRCARGHRHRVLRVREEKERAGDRLRPFDRWTVLCPAVLQLRLLAERHHA